MDQEDSAVLSAVRAFLMEEEADVALDSDNDESPFDVFTEDSVLVSVVNESTPQSMTAAREKKPKETAATRPIMINRSRLRMQREISLLRQKSIALERRLSEVRGDGATGSTAHAPTKAAHSTGWYAHVLTQRELLEAAETERQTLRETIASYKAAVKRVRRVVRKQIRTQSTLAGVISPGIVRHSVLHLDTAAAFQELSGHLQTMKAQLKTFLQAPQLDSQLTEQFQHLGLGNVQHSPDLTLEFAESRLLPFDVDTTAKAVWFYHRHMTAGSAGHVHEEFMDTPDRIRQSYVSTMALPSYSGKVHGRVEAWRIVSKDCIVILQSSIFHRMQQSTNDFNTVDGFGARIFKWTVIGPPHSPGHRAIDRPLSQVDEFEVLLPFFADNMRNSPDRDELRAFALSSIEFVHAVERQAVENILLDGAGAL